jgi:hypothetical protein
MPESRSIPPGGSFEFKLDLQNGEWKIPDGLPSPLKGFKARGWYLPLRSAVFDPMALEDLVTQDPFAGECYDLPPWQGIIPRKKD